MAAASYSVDPKLDATLDELRKHYGVESKAEVLHKAIALLKVASDHELPDGSIVLVTRQKQELRVLMR